MIYLYGFGCFDLNEEDIFHMEFPTQKITLGMVMMILTTDAQKHCRIFFILWKYLLQYAIIDTRINFIHEKTKLDANVKKK